MKYLRLSGRLPLCLLFLIFVVASGVSAALPEVEKIEGSATLKKPGKGEPVVLKAGAKIPEGSKIQTKLGTRLTIKIDNGSTINLRENSVFEVVKNSGGKYDFKLWVGELRTSVKNLKPTEVYNVRTGVAVAGVRGTDFSVGADEDGTTDLAVYEGLVEFKSLLSGAAVMVGANQSAQIDPSGNVGTVASGASDEDAEDAPTATTGAASTSTVALQITAPITGSVSSNRAVAVLGNAQAGATVLVNGVPVTADPSGRFSTFVNLVEGMNVIAAELNGERREVTVTVDSLRPDITVGAFSEITNVSTARLTVTTKDGATVAAGGAATIATGGVASLALTLNEGENLITITSTDARGLSAQKTIRITLDSIRPTLTILSMTSTPAGVRASGLTEPLVTVTANGYPLDVRSDGSFDQILAGLAAGEVTFEAKDQAGNITRDARNVTGTVDNSAPSLVSLSFSPGSVEVGSSVSVTLQAADASALSPTLAFGLTGSLGGSLSTTLSASGTTYLGAISVANSATAGVYSSDPVTLSDVLGNTATFSPSTTLVVTNTSPAAPASVSAVDATTGQAATVSWSAVSATDLADYTLNQGSSPSGPWTPIYVGSGTSKSVTGLVNGTTYYYHVTSRDNAGNVSNASTVASVTPTDIQPPSTPTLTSATGISSSQITVSWNSSAGASSYKVYRSLNAGGGAPWMYLTTVGGTSTTAGGLSPSTTYYFSVTALDNIPNESTVGANSISGATTP